MSRHYESTAARCPFYKWEDERKREGKPAIKMLVCEGFVRGQRMTLSFSAHRRFESWCSRYCRGAWKSCPLAAGKGRE